MAESRPKKRSKAYYMKPGAKQFRRLHDLSTEMCGVLITTDGRERQCVAEVYDLFNEYADALYGTDFDTDLEEKTEEDVDLEGEFASEVKRLKRGNQRRFQVANSGARNVIFIECRNAIDPCKLVHAILSDTQTSGVCRARYCQRLTPVSVVCRASLQDIAKHALPLLQSHFHYSVDPKPVQFSVHCKLRNNATLKRDKVINLLASLVTDEGAYPHIVCLDNPQLVICANVIKGLCCLSVLKDFIVLKQYNIQAVCGDKRNDTVTDTVDQQVKPALQSVDEN